MPIALLQLSFTQVIDAASNTDFEKAVLHLSYQEYKMKSQAYDPDGSIPTFSALKANDGRANSLHYKTGFAISGLVESLKHIIPGLTDNAGSPTRFVTSRFEVLESDIYDQSAHRVAIHYITDWFTLYQVIGNHLVLSVKNDLDTAYTKPVETFSLQLQDGLSIVQYQEFP